MVICSLEWNEDPVTVFLKWTDFRQGFNAVHCNGAIKIPIGAQQLVVSYFNTALLHIDCVAIIRASVCAITNVTQLVFNPGKNI